MEVQLIITFTTILGAVAYTLYQLVKLCLPQKTACGSGTCSGCDFKQELRKRKLSPTHQK
ncbi:MAG: hypothetical protein ACEPOZ_08715 [Marinifilaceae bacterium]